jgi:hypothetical protein
MENTVGEENQKRIKFSILQGGTLSSKKKLALSSPMQDTNIAKLLFRAIETLCNGSTKCFS